MRLFVGTALSLIFASPAFAQTSAATPAPASAAKPDDKPKWDVNAPTGLTVRQVPIDVTEGTWMNLDLSPDGRTIAFDLLGDIYTLPIEGGNARRVAEGLAFEQHPRFSPDGRRIAFTSDRGGGDNIWVMNADGGDKRQVTKEDFRLLNQPSWSPDGRFIAAKKHFTTQRSLGTGEIWLYHVSGGGGVMLVKRPSEQHQKELGEPTYAPDGRHVYFTRNTTPGPIFEYAQDSNGQLFAIERYDIETGQTERVAEGAGGAVRPQPSPDGSKLAFVKRERTKSKLYVKDLKTGEERKIYDALDQDLQETWAVHGVYPNMAWTPDSRDLIFWAGGKIWRIGADGSRARQIPFRVTDSRGVIDPPRPAIAVAPTSFETRMPRFASVSPDGRQVVFETLGRLWIKPAGGGSARAITAANERAIYPSWSRDGRSIAYVGWTDAGLGRVKTIAPGGGSARTLTSEPGHYYRPRFSPDGRTIVFEKTTGGFLTSPRGSVSPGVYRVAAGGGSPEWIGKDLAGPHFGRANDRIFATEAGEGGKRSLVSVDLNGEGKRTHATGDLVTTYEVSPTGEFFAFKENYEAFVMPLLPGTQAIAAGVKANALPVTRVSSGGADYLGWSRGGEALNWSIGPTLYTATTAQLFGTAPTAPGATAAKFTPPSQGVSLSMPATLDRPSGRVALTGARIVTMAAADGGVIDNGVIVIEGDRIVSVGPLAATTLPAGTRTVDVSGKTIIPGLVDAHAHGPYGVDELTPEQNWSLHANLALGVTTTHDPSSAAGNVFPASEMQRAGLILGPRTFSTGEIIYGARSPDVYAQIESLDDARAHVRRLKAQGAHSVKNYNQPRREQRQQVVKASIEEGMRSVAEGGSLYGMDIALIADGNTTLEHNIPQNVLYKDVIDFYAGTKVGYTPTLVVTYGGLAGDPYWRARTDNWTHPILSRHAPPTQLAANSVRRTTAPDEDFVDDDSAREAAKLARAGVPVAIGAHGQEAGIAAHWEMWSFARGGMSPIEALAAGTIASARSLGYDRDIGSLEPGKLADLVVLDADPTQDIRNSDKVSKVMLGGRLYDARTLNEEVTGDRKRQPYFWEQ